jgi:hypothetical protein
MGAAWAGGGVAEEAVFEEVKDLVLEERREVNGVDG